MQQLGRVLISQLVRVGFIPFGQTTNANDELVVLVVVGLVGRREALVRVLVRFLVQVRVRVLVLIRREEA